MVNIFHKWSLLGIANDKSRLSRVFHRELSIILNHVSVTSNDRWVVIVKWSVPMLCWEISRKEILCNHNSIWICRLFPNYCYESSLIFFPRWNKYRLNLLCVWCIGGKRQTSFVVSLYCQAYTCTIHDQGRQWSRFYQHVTQLTVKSSPKRGRSIRYHLNKTRLSILGQDFGCTAHYAEHVISWPVTDHSGKKSCRIYVASDIPSPH